ncbi:hypothetical protein METP2_03510 [Methanosarcinales archaeon]|nr:hypothetical protein METP2_03510 [Methanosarcinales archaeon]
MKMGLVCSTRIENNVIFSLKWDLGQPVMESLMEIEKIVHA